MTKTCAKHIKSPAKGYSPCAGCEIEHLQAQVKGLKAKIEEIQSKPAWVSVVDSLPPPNVPVIAFVGANEFGKTRRIRAQYAPPLTLELDSDAEGGLYDEKSDTYYCKEGWYESNEYEDVHWYVDDIVSHWMALPEGPGNHGQ